MWGVYFTIAASSFMGTVRSQEMESRKGHPQQLYEGWSTYLATIPSSEYWYESGTLQTGGAMDNRFNKYVKVLSDMALNGGVSLNFLSIGACDGDQVCVSSSTLRAELIHVTMCI